jgi:hypothetical protein
MSVGAIWPISVFQHQQRCGGSDHSTSDRQGDQIQLDDAVVLGGVEDADTEDGHQQVQVAQLVGQDLGIFRMGLRQSSLERRLGILVCNDWAGISTASNRKRRGRRVGRRKGQEGWKEEEEEEKKEAADIQLVLSNHAVAKPRTTAGHGKRSSPVSKHASDEEELRVASLPYGI